MNEIEFKNWLIQKGFSPKVVGDAVYRLKRVERELDNCDIDEQYCKDKCKYLFSLFSNRGENEEMKKYPNTHLPIGKAYLCTYRHAVKQYIQFKDETTSDSQ